MRYDSLLGFAAVSEIAVALALDCSSSALQAVLPSNVTVNFATLLRANATFQVPQSDTGYPNSPIGLPALCAVSAQVPSIGNTTFGFGLFLPNDWNGRFLAVGNGGFAGGVNWEDMVFMDPLDGQRWWLIQCAGSRHPLWICYHVHRHGPQFVEF